MRTNKIGLHPNEVPRGPMHSVTLDFITKLPKAGPGGVYTVVAVLVDRFSKKVFGIPMIERESAIDVAHKLYASVFES